MCSVIARYRSHVSTIAFILSGKLITKLLDIDLELTGDDVPGPGRVIFSVMPRPRIGSLMRQRLADTQLFSHKRPVLVEPFEFPNEIGQHGSVGIDEPIQLVAVRG